ncbi:MAG: glycosyltransferase [Nanoarchaeota archaeon]|nr:glycosyltransferase [Nanoarchaeota archaeon]MBU1643553.1 glycosyltransferase [Nanoarchaeota archaeon]MBU1976633.1 glycosyltransferase [Nanoarchaeota archaeon]
MNKKIKREPFFTTIVPAYNEEKSIEKTLQSLVDLDYPSEKMEIIVVNDGSTDRTKEIVAGFMETNPARNIVLINQENRGKGNAMNNGLRKAKGEFFACLDADSFVNPDALGIMLPMFEDQDVAAVCPLLKVKKPSSILGKVQWCEYIINMYYRYLNAKLHCIHVTPGPFSVYRTKIINDLGGYDETTITEDLEIAIRLQKHHYKILQTFDTIVETEAPKSWKTLFKQRVRWYKGAVDNTVRYRNLAFNKKYGDFGMVRMPTVVASGVISIILVVAMLQSLIRKGYQLFLTLKDVNFDIITLLKNYTFQFNILKLPFFKITIAITLMAISLFVMVYSFKLVKEKITNYGRTWLSLMTYLLVYGLFLTTVWIYIAYMLVAKKRNFWN